MRNKRSRSATAEEATIKMECVMFKKHKARVSACSNGAWTAYCDTCRTRVFFSEETFKALDRAGQIRYGSNEDQPK